MDCQSVALDLKFFFTSERQMAVPHGDFAIPDGFPALLKDFAKEVLRAQVRFRAMPPCAVRSLVVCGH